jgi:hypothetical protein
MTANICNQSKSLHGIIYYNYKTIEDSTTEVNKKLLDRNNKNGKIV